MRTLVAGMALSGVAVARRLAVEGLAFDCFDELKPRQAVADAVGSDEFEFFRSEAEIDWACYDQVIVSPGIDCQHSLLIGAARSGVPVWSEIEFAFRRARGRIVAVTGTNGKSTTVSLIHHLLSGAGMKSVLCGNIGSPFTEGLSSDEATVYVIEVSSFQLEHVRDFRPDIGLLLNLFPDHLDRHRGFEGYRDAKLTLFARQTSADLALFPQGFDTPLPGDGKKIELPGAEAVLGDDGFLINGQYRVGLEFLPLLGEHNRLNALFALAVCERLGIPAATAGPVMAQFKPLEHRLEGIGTFNGRSWINDSKATNVRAAQMAIWAMDGPYVLILGGYDKGERFGALEFGDRPPRRIIAYGQTAPKILEDLAAYHPLEVPEFRQACLEAHGSAREGDVVLLAPACASFGQHQNFMDRGRAFKQYFRELSQSHADQFSS